METANFMKLFYLIIIVSLDHTICKDDVLVKSCPEDKANWDTAARRKECKPEGGRNYVYHCLKNEGQQLVETCLVAQWIEIGVCPVLFIGGNFGFENCTLIMLRTGGACPKTAYRSNELHRFPICFDINQPKSTTTQPNKSAETTIGSVTSIPEFGNSSRYTTNGNENTTKLIPRNGDFIREELLIIIFIIIFLFVVLGVWVYYYRRKARKDVENGPERPAEQDSSTGSTDVQQRQEKKEEEVPLLNDKESKGTPEMRIVQLAAFAEGLHILKEHGILIITGQIGSGKTTAMENIIKRLQDEDSEWKEKDISFLRPGRSNSSNDKLVIKWDDCFGKFVTYPGKKKKTLDMFTEICKWVAEGDGNRKCILTMRETEFVSFSLYESALFMSNDKVTTNKVCLNNLTEREKALLLEISKEVCSCGECTDIHKTNITNKLMAETESVTLSLLGLPLMCRLATVPYIGKNINSFRKDPVRCVMSLFDTLESTNQQLYCAMIYVLFKGGNTNICRIDSVFIREVCKKIAPAQDGEKLMDTFSAQDGEKLISTGKGDSTDVQVKTLSRRLNNIFLTQLHYFVHKEKECFDFHHEIFILWLLFHFYKKHPEMTIEHFEFDVLTELLRPINYTVEVHERDFEMLCNFEEKDAVPKEYAVVEKHNYPTELLEGDGDKKPVQCEEDTEQRVHFETGIQTISSDALKQREEGKTENQTWKFTLEEKMFPCFVKRVVNEKEKYQKLQVEKEQKYDILEDHPFLKDKTFERIYKQEEALTSVHGSK